MQIFSASKRSWLCSKSPGRLANYSKSGTEAAIGAAHESRGGITHPLGNDLLDLGESFAIGATIAFAECRSHSNLRALLGKNCMPDVMKTLLLNPPSFDRFDGGASSRWPATREIESYWYPVWLAYPTERSLDRGCLMLLRTMSPKNRPSRFPRITISWFFSPLPWALRAISA